MKLFKFAAGKLLFIFKINLSNEMTVDGSYCL